MYTNPFGAGGTNPFTGLEKQLEQQLSEIRTLAQQTVKPATDQYLVQMVRTEVDRYLQERETPAAGSPMSKIVAAVESSLPVDDVKYLAANIERLPSFLGGGDGKDLLKMVVDGLRKAGGPDAVVTAAPGEATG